MASRMADSKIQFSEWLHRRQRIPSVKALTTLRKFHTENDRELTIYSICDVLDALKHSEVSEFVPPHYRQILSELLDFGAFQLIMYCQNRYFPSLTEDEISKLLSAYDFFEPESNTCYTFEALLSTLSRNMGIDTEIKHEECCVCLGYLDKTSVRLPCEHLYHKDCAPKLECYICKQ